MKWNKKIAKKVEKLIDSAPDHCISCGEKFPHLGHTFTGVRGEKPVITGHCCKDKLKWPRKMRQVYKQRTGT